MFGGVVLGVGHEHFEEAFDKIKRKYRVKQDTDVPAEGMVALCDAYKKVYQRHVGKAFPQDPYTQLELAIEAVFGSWNTPRAVRYREVENIRGLLGTAVNVQSMVYGNMGDDSGTGVAFTRDPSTGENTFYGEFLVNAQGEDVVAGIRTPQDVAEMPKWNKRVYQQLLKIKKTLENHYRDMQDILGRGKSEAVSLNYGATPPNPSEAGDPFPPYWLQSDAPAARWRNQLGVIGSHRVLPSQKPGRKVRKLDENASPRTRNSPETATTCLRRPTRRIKIPINYQ